MLEASSQQKQECKPHSFHECAACEGGKVKGAVIQRNCKQEVLILSFPIRPYIQSKQNHFFLQNLILGKSQVIHRYQGMYTVYCFFPDIDFFSILSWLFCFEQPCAALLCIILVNLMINEWIPEKEMESEHLNVILWLTLAATGLWFTEQYSKDGQVHLYSSFFCWWQLTEAELRLFNPFHSKVSLLNTLRLK